MASIGQTVDNWVLSAHSLPSDLSSLECIPNCEEYQIRVVLKSGKNVITTAKNFSAIVKKIRKADVCGVWTQAV